MGKASAHKAKSDAKKAIKDKKKFKNRNSIGKAKKKVGSAGRYMTRTNAVNRLQVSLKDFRKLCILKGIYPREPKKKFKGGNTTYFFAKDILFLMHEPLLARFRDQKAFLKKITKALGRHEKLKARRLESRKPVYKLDHLIRERYPTFVDALHELDDVLCLVFLFASLSPSQYVPAARVEACSRLRRELMAYVARTRALRYVFISIKGIYYQADVCGVTLTWVEPHHSFAQQPTMAVDYRVMTSFLELYEAVLTFVNFKLYHDLGMVYPPQIDAKADGAGAFLSAALLAAKPANAPAEALVQPTTSSGEQRSAPAKALSKKQLASLHSKLQEVDQQTEPDGTIVVADPAGEADAVDFDAAGLEAASLSPEVAALRSLYSSCVFFCGRETPVQSLEFIIASCGGRVGWEGDASPFGINDERITHHVIDRPQAGEHDGAKREHVQPQWVFDSINARSLLPTYAYRPGVKCPPHLSPFVDAGKGEETKERELAAEVAGAAYADPSAAKASTSKRKSASATGGKVSDGGKVSEDKELAMMMMSRKKRRLYDRMQYGIGKKAEAEDKLREKREAIDAAAAKAKKGAKKKSPKV